MVLTNLDESDQYIGHIRRPDREWVWAVTAEPTWFSPDGTAHAYDRHGWVACATGVRLWLGRVANEGDPICTECGLRVFGAQT